MYYKNFEHFIILCLIKQLTLLLYVSGRPTDGEEIKIFSDKQLNYLASEVCSELSLYGLHVTQETCRENFYAPDASSPRLEPPLKIKCQSSGTTRFLIEPSESWQLVAWVPHSTDNDTARNYWTTTHDEWFKITHSLIEANTELGEISTTPNSNYTIWSTVLKEGSPVQWRGGDKAPDYSKAAENRSYDIKHYFYPNVADSLAVDGLFVWNTSGDGDACFDVVNVCQDIGLTYNQVLPDSKSAEPQIIFDSLPLDVDCVFKVVGLHGTTKMRYRTPSCDDKDCLRLRVKPGIAENITIMASEDSADTWEVVINWSLPHRLPDSYNVTLRTEDETQSMVLPGDATEAIFRDVEGDDLYNMTIYAALGRVIAVTSRRAKFPSRRSAGGAGGGAAVGLACAAAAALALLCRCRRQQQHAAVPIYKPQDDKPPKDNESEVLEVWSETEDRWEVRTDKLVLHEVIGEGAFGVVRRATLAPQHTLVAVKMLKDFPSLEEIRSFRSEMELMKSVGVHPHIVSLVGCCTGRRPLIVAEYCSRGDLLSYLRCTWDVMLSKHNARYYNNNIDISDYRNDLFKCKPQMEDSKLVVNKLYELQEICDKELTALDLLSFCRQIAMGMEFLAANRVVHRDLAARNILVTADRTLKIADFGLSRDVYEENQYKQKGNGKMPVKWMALESLTRRIYTTQSDVWSFGVVVWEVATVGGAPYAAVPAARLPRLLRAGYRMPRPANCSTHLYDIMLSCWRTHPRDRPTFAELHQQLDDLLNSACANQYLSLEIDADDAPPTPKHHRYIKMLIRGKRNWSRGENYERPLKALHTNHYTTPPDSLSQHPL